MERKSSIFGSLKSKLSRKPSSTSPNDSKSEAASYSSPATRRPDDQRPGTLTSTNDATSPPPYSSTPIAGSSSAPRRLGTGWSDVPDGQLASLADVDTVFLIDDSGSMAGSRWNETREALQAIAPVCTQYDDDGIDIYFLNAGARPNSPYHYLMETCKNVKEASTVLEIFSVIKPGGSTPTATRIWFIVNEYIQKYKNSENRYAVKPLNLIVITDGEANTSPAENILTLGRMLDELGAPPRQVGIQFFQVGNDPDATKALQRLDDDLAKAGEGRDMVDTVPYRKDGSSGKTISGPGILKVVLGAISKEVDADQQIKKDDQHDRK